MPISLVTWHTIFHGPHVHNHDRILFLQFNSWSQASVDNDNFSQRAKLTHPQDHRTFLQPLDSVFTQLLYQHSILIAIMAGALFFESILPFVLVLAGVRGVHCGMFGLHMCMRMWC